MVVVSKIAGPAVWLLDASTRLVFRAVGLSTEREVRVTDEEIKALIAEAERAGVLETSEREMLSGVMRLADRTVVGLMTRGRMSTDRHHGITRGDKGAPDQHTALAFASRRRLDRQHDRGHPNA